MEYEWDPIKATANRRKHGVDFADAGTVLHDPHALTIPDDIADEEDRLSRSAWMLSAGSSWSTRGVSWSTRGVEVVHDSSRRERRHAGSNDSTRVPHEEAV